MMQKHVTSPVHARFALPLLVLLLVITGCRGNKTKGENEKVSEPTARFVGARLVSATEQGARIEISVELENPNGVSLPLVESRYTLSLGGAKAAHGVDRPNRTLPAKGRQIVLIPVAVEGTVSAGAAFSVHGAVAYEPPGEVRKVLTESKVPLPRVSFEGAGNLQ